MVEEITTTVYSPKITTMKLRLNQSKKHDDNDNVFALCSPPPHDEKDVEHMRRFELEI